MRAWILAVAAVLLFPATSMAANYQDNLGSAAAYAAGGHKVTGTGNVNGGVYATNSVTVAHTGSTVTGSAASAEAVKVSNLRSAYQTLDSEDFSGSFPEATEGVFSQNSILVNKDEILNPSLTGMTILNTSSLQVNGTLNGSCNLVVIADHAIINGNFTGLLIAEGSVVINGSLTGNVYSVNGDVTVNGVVNSMNCTPPTPPVVPPTEDPKCPDGTEMKNGGCPTPVVPPTVTPVTPSPEVPTPKEDTPKKSPFVVKNPKTPKCSNGVFTVTITGKGLVKAKVLRRIVKSQKDGKLIKFKLNRGDLSSKGVAVKVSGKSKSKTFRIKRPPLCSNVKAKQKVAVTG